MKSGNLFEKLNPRADAEQFERLLDQPGIRVERIVSLGQSTPDGQWYDQDWTEWVVVLQGRALLQIESEPAPRELSAGDWLELPPHARHRVEATDPAVPTVWLAIHLGLQD
jgi:cupin 2 domain-containing protein